MFGRLALVMNYTVTSLYKRYQQITKWDPSLPDLPSVDNAPLVAKIGGTKECQNAEEARPPRCFERVLVGGGGRVVV